MRSKLLLLAVTLFSSAKADAAATTPAAPAKPVRTGGEEFSTSNRVGCVADLKGYHFNLKELSLPIDETDRTKSQMYELEFQDKAGTSSIQFNLCEETARRCPDLMVDHANIVNSVGTCNHLSRVQMDGEQRPGTLSLISEDNPRLGVVMNYEGGNMCNETSHFSLQVQINCNENLDKTTFALDKESLKTPCDPRVIMNSPHACPVLTTGPLGTILEKYNYYIGIPMLAIGGYLCFVSGQFPGVTLLLFTTLAVSMAQLFALYIFVFPGFFPTWTIAVVFPVTLGMGVGLGYGASKWPRIGMVVMGLSMGSLLGFILYYAFMASSVNSTVAKLLTIGGVALATAIIYTLLFDHMIIVTSAVFGSYILVRAITMYTGGYVNEFEVILAASNGDLGLVRWTTFLFWALMIIVAIVSTKVQLASRTTALDAFQYKFRGGAPPASYDSIRERAQRMSGRDSERPYFNERGDDESTLMHHKQL